MRRILIFYNHFSPAKKAGGIVRSLENLVNLLINDYECFVITSAFDFGDGHAMIGISPNRWNVLKRNLSVFYLRGFLYAVSIIRSQIRFVSPDIIYVNGFFTPTFVIIPLLITRFLKYPPQIVIAPRGMFQHGALQRGYVKKKFYLEAFKFLRLHRNVRWHATDQQEWQDISSFFGEDISGAVVGNVPMSSPFGVVPIEKRPKAIRLLYLSLITEKKNLLFLIKSLRWVSTEYNITLDIYGPVKDRSYWALCLQQSRLLPPNLIFAYKGLVEPASVMVTFKNYHFFVLPTLGENFGHSIYESLAAGRPVIISDKTPWRDLQKFKAGFDLPLNEESFVSAIEFAANMDQETFMEYSRGATEVANSYLKRNDFVVQYRGLFEK